MYNNDAGDYSQSITDCLKTEEKELPSAYHEICEHDELEVTALGNIVDNEICENDELEVTALGNIVDNEICENDEELEVTPLGNIVDNETINNADSASSDGRSNSEFKRNLSFGIQDNCEICQNKIYPMEKLNLDGKLYHKNCFRCFKCRTILSVSNFTLNNNVIYCKTHFMELFKIRGKFDDDGDIPNEIISGNDAEIIPTIDTKGLLAKFKEMETGSTSTPQPNFTNRSNSNSTPRYTQPANDIVRFDDLPLDELPAPETARAMVAKFKAMESNGNIPSPYSVEKMQQRAKTTSTTNSNVRLQAVGAQVVASEEDYNTAEILPEEGSTKNLLSKFQEATKSN